MIAMDEMTQDEVEDVFRNLNETESMDLQEAAHRRAVDTFDDDKLSHLDAAAEDPDCSFEWDYEFYFSGYKYPDDPRSEYLDIYAPVGPGTDRETCEIAKDFGDEMLKHLMTEIRAAHIDEDDEDDDSEDDTPDDIIVHGRSREHTTSPHGPAGCSETLEVEHGDEIEHVPLSDVRPAGYDLIGDGWGDDIPTMIDMDRVYLYEGEDIRAEAMLPNGHVVEIYRDGVNSSWVLDAQHGAADPATREILWERPDALRSDLKMLFDLGLSPALAIDYHSCHIRGLSHRDQARWRSVTRQAVAQNVAKALNALND